MPFPKPFYRSSGTDLGLLDPYPDCGALIPGHVGAYFARGLGSHLRSTPRPFFLESSTWAFTRPPRYITKTTDKGDKTKLSYIALGDMLGEPFSNVVGKHKLKLEELSDPALRKATANWVTFQQGFTTSPEVEKVQKTLAEYDALAEKGSSAEHRTGSPTAPPPPSPTWVSSLSFPISKKEDPWFTKVLTSAEETCSMTGKAKTLLLVHVEGWSEGDLDLFDDVSSELPSSVGVELWLDGHSDYSQPRGLMDYVGIIKRLGRKGRFVVLAYSTLFGAFLSNAGVVASASGMGSSEEKTSTEEPASGGGYARYYLPLSSAPERVAECRLFFTEHPDQFCAEAACTAVLGRRPETPSDFDEFFKKFMMPESKKHFLETRNNELMAISSQRGGQVASGLREKLAHAERLNYGDYFRRSPRHLEAWAQIVDSLA